RARATQVAEDVLASAAGIFKGVGEDRELLQAQFTRRRALIVGGTGQGQGVGGAPGRLDSTGPEGVAEDVTGYPEELGLVVRTVGPLIAISLADQRSIALCSRLASGLAGVVIRGKSCRP